MFAVGRFDIATHGYQARAQDSGLRAENYRAARAHLLGRRAAFFFCASEKRTFSAPLTNLVQEVACRMMKI